MNTVQASQEVSAGEIIEIAAKVYKNSDFESTWSICRKGLDIMPQNQDLLHFMGVLAHQSGAEKLGWDLIQRSIALTQTSSLDHQMVWTAYASMNLAGRAGRLHEAALRAHECVRTGDMCRYRQQLEAADSLYRRALEIIPHLSEVKFKLARVLWEQCSYQEAQTHYLQNLQIAGEPTRDREISILPVKGIKTYCEQKDYKYVRIYPSEQCCLYKHEVFGRSGDVSPTTAMMPEIYVAELRNVYVFGENTPLVTEDGVLLYDLAGHPGSERFELATRGVKFCDRTNGLIDFPKADTRVIDEAIMLSGGSSTWAHWLIETLPRFSLLESFPEYDKLPLVLDEASILDPHNRETLRRLNKTGREIILLKRNQRYRCKRLIYPSKLVRLPSDLKPWAEIRPGDELVSSRSIDFIRKAFFDSGSSGARDEKTRIYIPRQGAGYRRLLNEVDIHRIFERYGFIDVHPEQLSFQEKLEIFGNAEIIGGPGSSGLANQKFAPPGTILLTLIPEPWVTNSLPPTISALLGQRHLCVAGMILPDTHSQPYHCDYTVDPNAVEEALKMLTASLDRPNYTQRHN